jgi:hypothetical protein
LFEDDELNEYFVSVFTKEEESTLPEVFCKEERKVIIGTIKTEER